MTEESRRVMEEPRLARGCRPGGKGGSLERERNVPDIFDIKLSSKSININVFCYFNLVD